MKLAADFTYNEHLKDLIEKLDLSYREVNEIMRNAYAKNGLYGDYRKNISTVHYWVINKYRLRKEIFNAFLEELPVFLENRVEDLTNKIDVYKNIYKEVMSVVHNNLHDA